ncbi:hypothetical protein DRN98_00895 [Methanosarcinales archaeon]|uniref:Restriction endonuclease n=1 Tax=Desulfofervidus auxilii TaxID=1621989 RepID=A0A7V1N296_DESA2|nr:MAG: hypothetical protein B5M53_06350 [Candidatus Cloacimonas sp. 4484_209]RLG35607.1 MAG: hypothetical protein DRN98_00895 [Methanosarcinales archaeon]HEB73778.1 hypothetical protein [Candidatus Desulfofervidus auxilii]
MKKEWDKTQDWFWEGNIQEKIANYMEITEGFKVTEKANTESKKQGPDIKGEKDGKYRIVAIKGYPSDKYTANFPGGKKGEKKRTNPNTQARHWFSEALVEILLRKCSDPNIEIALGFPYFKVYENLVERITWLRSKVGISCYFVKEAGEVIYLHSD